MKLLRQLRDLFCYCGLGKEEYSEIKIEAYKANFRAWKYLHLLMVVVFAFVTMAAKKTPDVSAAVIVRLVPLVYAIVTSILFWYVFKEESLLAQFMIYFSMIVLLCYGLWVGISRNNMMAVTFVAYLVILPVFMIDKPYFMALLLSAASAIYLSFAKGIKTADAYRGDVINICIFCVIGIIINTFCNYIRIHEFKYKEQEQEAYSRVTNLNTSLKKMSENLVDMLGNIVESRDTESGDHIARVKGYTNILATQVMMDCPEYGLDNYTVNVITFASALHDVGKIAISDSILLKPGKLTPEELETMKTHCEKGCEIIKKMSDSWSKDYLDMGLTIALSHHEKWDGRGYPHGLKGDEIPIAAQIVSVADVYDALTTKRVYKDAYSLDKAFEMIINGECGAFSDKLMGCFRKCKSKFEEHADNPEALQFVDYDFEITTNDRGTGHSFVIGFHDEDKTLQEKNRLKEEVSVLSALSSYNYYYICYIDMPTNQVYRYMASPQFAKILDSFGDELKSNEKFDKLLNTVIVSEDLAPFLEAISRESAIETIHNTGSLTTEFRIRIDDGIHYCGMRIVPDPSDREAVILGIYNRDDSQAREAKYFAIQRELEKTKLEIENKDKLEDRLAVINTLSDDYDYVCSINADTMDVIVYKAKDWIKDMFKNLEDIVKSPEARDETLRGIIYPDDFEEFKEASKHENVVKNLAKSGEYTVNYRGYKYGELVNYQTRYTVDRNNPKRIIIGLRQVYGI